MSIAEIKESLHEQIERLSEEQLPAVQKFFQEMETKEAKPKPSMQEIWKELTDKYDSTLRRLAQ